MKLFRIDELSTVFTSMYGVIKAAGPKMEAILQMQRMQKTFARQCL